MEDPNVIATLIATSELARQAFSSPHNYDRCFPCAVSPSLGSRENTPFPDGEDDFAPRIHLTFDKPPESIKNGYVFGYDPSCDVRLADRRHVSKLPKTRFVSKNHFSITFDAQHRVILRDSSKVGTAVSYNGQAQNEVRSRFTWIIFPDFELIEVKIPEADISFKIQLAKHKTCESNYLANVDSVLRDMRETEEGPGEGPKDTGLTFPLNMLNVSSQDTTAVPSTATTPREVPIHLILESIGRGEFGRVYKVVNVSTGDFLAGKEVLQPKWEREVQILSKVSHENIVSFVDFRPKPTPLLIMEYLPLGNLEDQHKASRIAYEEASTILVQALRALDHLHSQKLAHRDIKPANILVLSRYPLHIKLSDFGLAKDIAGGETLLKSRVGSWAYAAPEIWEGSPYTQAVDIWSLAVVILQYSYNLPTPNRGDFNAQDWHKRIIKAIRDYGSGDLIDLMRDHMLQIQSERRQSARVLLARATALLTAVQDASGLQQADWTPTERASTICDELHPRDCEYLMATRVQASSYRPDELISIPGQSTHRKARLLRPQDQRGQTPDRVSEVFTSQPSCGGVEVPQRKRQRLDIAYKSRGCPTWYKQATIAGSNFSVRESDGWIDALEILTLAKLDTSQRKYYRKLVWQSSRSEHSAYSKHRRWIPYADAKLLCDHLGLTHELGGVLRDALNYASLRDERPSQAFLAFAHFESVHLGTYQIHVRTTDLWVNATNIVKAAGHVNDGHIRDRADLKPVDIIKKGPSRGTYVSPAKGLLLCGNYDLDDLGKRLETFLQERGFDTNDALLSKNENSGCDRPEVGINPRPSRTSTTESSIESTKAGAPANTRARSTEAEPHDLASGHSSNADEISPAVRNLDYDSQSNRVPAQEAATDRTDARNTVFQNPDTARSRTQSRVSYYAEPSFGAGSFLPTLDTSFLLPAGEGDQPKTGSHYINTNARDPEVLPSRVQVSAHPSWEYLSPDLRSSTC